MEVRRVPLSSRKSQEWSLAPSINSEDICEALEFKAQRQRNNSKICSTKLNYLLGKSLKNQVFCLRLRNIPDDSKKSIWQSTETENDFTPLSFIN